ncbi:hypothetical protein LO763_09865 [Glycomyces sp. A-F 0318]|uniref:hypothetical protein n=1 Tax=Glycomyces amatae TaxID=2881355 RepID=UPI001E4C350B|nr:hypothetical protein [Glycomyces amatae]MCD0443929.1 hypothetical protein [Glycomyces amatae]
MSALFEEMPFSEFLHQPAATAARLEEVRSIRLRRRGADDLALVRADQTDRDATVIDFTARLLAGLAKAGEAEAIRRVLAEALPWSTFLPETDRDQLLSELIEVAQGAASLRNLGPVSVLLEQWRHSAEIYADPDTHRQVTAEPGGDLGRVHLPGATA